MYIKRSGKTIYGAEFTAAEQKAIDLELDRQFAERTRKHVNEIDAMILWELHKQLGLGPKRLIEFHNNFAPVMDALLDRYSGEATDEAWLCTHQLKEYGVDIEELNKERN